MAEIFSVIWPVNADLGEVTCADDGCAVSRCGSAVPGQRTVPGWFVRFTGRKWCRTNPPNDPEMTLPPIDHKPNYGNRTGQIPLKVTARRVDFSCRDPEFVSFSGFRVISVSFSGFGV